MSKITAKILPRTDAGNVSNDHRDDRGYLNRAEPAVDGLPKFVALKPETAALPEKEPRRKTIPLDTALEDFHAYLPTHTYLDVPTGDLWSGSSVNAHVPWPKGADDKPIAPRQWLDQHRAIEQMTWAPSEPQLITDRIVRGGGWISQPGSKVFNLYRPPAIISGESRDHLRVLYPEEANHIERWLAQRVQRPDIKLNHALAMGGGQGIGKDSLCEPVKRAVGP